MFLYLYLACLCLWGLAFSPSTVAQNSTTIITPAKTTNITPTTSRNTTYTILNGTNTVKPGCVSQCGNLTVPYPFGIGEETGCAFDSSYEILCNTSFNPPKPFIGTIEIYDISDNQLRVSNLIAMKCYDSTGAVVKERTVSTDLRGSPLSFSAVNRFTVIGCDDFALITGLTGRTFTGGCVSSCSSKDEVLDGECSGIGCCQTSMPKGLKYYNISLISFNNHTDVFSFDACSYSFLGEQQSFTFGGAIDLSDPSFENRTLATVPLVLDWALGNNSCSIAQNTKEYACNGNTSGVDSNSGFGGYHCQCDTGYQGNPYVIPGCQDINECADPNTNDCDKTCTNTPGNYYCSCPKGFSGDGVRKGSVPGCIAESKHFPIIKLCLGLGFVFLFLMVLITWLSFVLQNRKRTKTRDKFFEQNGGLLLKQQLSSNAGVQSTKIFTSEELKKSNQYVCR